MPIVKKARDWRLLENREELFFRYLEWRLKVHDLDHSHYCKYLTKDMSLSQKCWFALLFGMTYRTPQAYAYWHHFRDFDNIDTKELSEWHKDNWKRTSYGTDTRYNKGHFEEQVIAIKEWIGDIPLLSKFTITLNESNYGKDSFTALFNSICSIPRYGRMTAWITCQCLYDITYILIDFDNVLVVSPEKDVSMKSVWNGYQMLKGRYDRLLGDSYSTNKEYKVSKEDFEETTKGLMEYKDNAETRLNRHIDIFKWESVWCQFKRLFNTKESKEYPGHATGDAVSRYLFYKTQWPEVDWSKFRQALLDQPGLVQCRTYRSNYNKIFGQTGHLLNMHEMFSDMSDGYEALDIDPNTDIVKDIYLDHNLEVPTLSSNNKLK